MAWCGVERGGVGWSGVEWNGVERNGVEWSGVEWLPYYYLAITRASYLAGYLPVWIPFGDHPLKLERYRED